MDNKNFQIAFWALSLLFVVCGLVVTIVGWKVNGNKAKSLAIKKDIHDSIDKSLTALKEFEDASYDFWLAKEPKILSYQLIVLHKRLTSSLIQLSELKNDPIPSHELFTLRRYATLDAETEARPLNFESERIKRVSRAATNIMEAKLLRKTWQESDSSTEPAFKK